VFPVFRSAAQTAILAELYLQEGSKTAAALGRSAGITTRAVLKWLPELESGGVIVADRSDTRARYRANVEAPFYPALRALLEVTVGPPSVLAAELMGLTDIEEIFIYGSWAQRAHDIAGGMPRDIDVVLIGDPDAGDVTTAAGRAAARLRREVHPLVVSPGAWAANNEPFLTTVKGGPLVRVAHEGTNSAGPAQEPAGDRAATGDWATALLTGEQ
jgi:hypothetical protein